MIYAIEIGLILMTICLWVIICGDIMNNRKMTFTSLWIAFFTGVVTLAIYSIWMFGDV